MKKILLAFALLFVALPTSFAGSVDMTCAQAKNYYNRHGRIYVRTNGGDIVPIYGLRRYCPPGYTASPYWVSTHDTRRCVLGYRCYRQDHNRDHGRRHR